MVISNLIGLLAGFMLLALAQDSVALKLVAQDEDTEYSVGKSPSNF